MSYETNNIWRWGRVPRERAAPFRALADVVGCARPSALPADADGSAMDEGFKGTNTLLCVRTKLLGALVGVREAATPLLVQPAHARLNVQPPAWEDFDEEEEEQGEDDERPLTRDELQRKTLRSSSKKDAKAKTGKLGKK